MTPRPFLCRLGWHRWKPVMRMTFDDPELRGQHWTIFDPFCPIPLIASLFDWRFSHVNDKCTRCGKRRSV